MTKFFFAAGLILGISVLIISYYWIKQLVKNYRDNKLKVLIQKKHLADEKEYLRNYISFHLQQLINNDIQWMMIWSKSNSIFKTELTYSPIDSKINIKSEKINSLNDHKLKLSKIGVTEYITNHENSLFKIIPNAKIVTDIIYYIFEDIYHFKIFSNHKIITSARQK